MYEMVNTVPFTAVEPDGKLKLHEAVGLMANCCQFQEYVEQDFRKFLVDNNIAVFLFSLQLDIFRMPEFRENITTAVKIYGCKSIYGLRQLTIRDADGKLCMIANATGAFFDLQAGKAIKLEPEKLNVKFDAPEEMECLPRKITIPESEVVKHPSFTVKPSHLDLNGHMTTPVYFSIATDVLPEQFEYNRVRIEFKQQAKTGDIIYPETRQSDGKYIVELKSDGILSNAVLEFSKRS
ncbi:MAG: hypothetical protein IKC77_06415 [Lentisphaeria bacterium]|nr:hypothetical protein [Lentisphaeria bacterium]